MTSFASKNVELLAWATYGIIKYLEIKFLNISCQLSCCVDENRGQDENRDQNENRGQDENKGRVNNSSSARHPWFFSFHILTLRKKVPVFGVFLARIFPHSDWIRIFTLKMSISNRNAGKYGPEKFRLRARFTQC